MSPRRRRWRLGLLGVVVAALAGGALWWTSADGPGGRSDGAEPGQRPVTDGDGERTAAPVSRGRALVLGVPIYDGDFADPYMLAVDGTYYAYATSTTDATLPAIELRDGVAPDLRSVDMTLPSWSTGEALWAPAVYAVGDGTYVLYFTTEVAATQRQCVSFAVADDPLGPFADGSSEPFVCQDDLGGTIDPSIVVDADGSPWLLYKNDGNCCDLPTSLWSQRLADDGRSLVGDPHRLLTAERDWEGDLIEAPSMIVDGTRHLLFYSANAWDTADYAIGYAECEGVDGPCERRDPSPWMSSEPITRGPGGQEFFAANDQLWMVYAAWRRGEIGYPEGQRRLFLDVVEVRDGVPTRLGGERTELLVVFLAGGAVALGAAFAGWRAHARSARRQAEAA